MALREKLAERAAPYLEPGEQVRHAFLAQSGMSPYLAFLSYIFIWMNKYWIIVVTDRATLVIRSSIWAPSKAKNLDRRVGRVPFGPMTGLWGKTDALGGDTIYIHKRFHKDVEAADAELTGGVPPAPAT